MKQIFTPRYFDAPTNTVRIAPISHIKGKIVCWWYGGIQKNHSAPTDPKLTVFFRYINGAGNINGWLTCQVSIAMLGMLRLWSIWENGYEIGELDGLETKKLSVDFTPGGWIFKSPFDAHSKHESSPIGLSDYPLKYHNDRNWLIDFRLGKGRNVLIPCMEYLASHYGASGQIPSILASRPWDLALKQLFSHQDAVAHHPNDDPWRISLHYRMRREDCVFLANVKYDPYARDAAKSIYSQLEAVFKASDRYAFPQVTPWFQGPANICVEGIRINGGHTFLALRLTGASEPKGVEIECIEGYENDGLKGGDTPQGNMPTSRLIHDTDAMLNWVVEQEPDHGSGRALIKERMFAVLEPKRGTRIVRAQREHRAVSVSGQLDDMDSSISSGESYGSGKRIGQADPSSAHALESKGVLRDVWNSLLFLQAHPEHSNKILSVQWFTFDKELQSSTEPELIQLPSIDSVDHDRCSSPDKNWPYLKARGKHKVPRGVLVARIVTDGTSLLLIELQRRAGMNGNEESFKGLLFWLQDPVCFKAKLIGVLAAICKERGRMDEVVKHYTKRVRAFRHDRGDNLDHPYAEKLMRLLGE